LLQEAGPHARQRSSALAGLHNVPCLQSQALHSLRAVLRTADSLPARLLQAKGVEAWVPHTSSHTDAAAAAAVDSAAGEQQPAVKRRRLSFEHSAAAVGATTAGAGSEQRQQQLSDSTLCAREHMQSGLSEEAGGLARGYTGAQAVCTLLEELSGCALNAVAFLRALDSAAADSSGDAAAALSQEALLLERTAALTHAIRALLPHYDARTNSSTNNSNSSCDSAGGTGVRELPSQAAGSATAATTAGPALPDMLQCLLSGYEAAARVVAQRTAPQAGQRATLWLWSMLVDAGMAWLHWAGAVPCVLTAVRAVALAATAAALQRSALSLDDGAAVLDRAPALSSNTTTACESRSSTRNSSSSGSNSRQRSEAAAAAAASLASLVDERLLHLSVGSAGAAVGSPARSRECSAAGTDSSVHAVLDTAHELPLLQRCLILLSCCGEASRPAAAAQDSSGSSRSATDVAATASTSLHLALTHSSAQVRACAVTVLPVLLETLMATTAAAATSGTAAADSTAQAQQQQLKLALDALQWTQQWEPALQQLLQDSSVQVRKLCAEALGQLACVFELTHVLATTATSSSAGSSSSSSAHFGLRVVPLACALGESEEVAVTAGAAAVLNRANSAPVLGPLMAACTRDAAPEVRQRASILCLT
jgi:HEAT repeat